MTGEGRELYELALRLLHKAEGIEQAAAASRSEPAGILRVTTRCRLEPIYSLQSCRGSWRSIRRSK
jgi:DNA-binding transcriptional LysR family regulator